MYTIIRNRKPIENKIDTDMYFFQLIFIDKKQGGGN